MLSFQNRAPDTKLLNFHANRDERAYFENVISKGSSFRDSETTIEFVTSKRVWE